MSGERKLISIEVTNFKGIKHQLIEFDNITNICGDNGTGKSTIFDAYQWCMSGKNSDGDSNFTIKPQDNEGNTIHHLCALVQLIWEIDGKKTILATEYKEVWRKKAGDTEKTLTGHTITYYVNEEPMLKKAYNDRVDEMFGLSMVRLLSDPLYYNSLHWEKQRDGLIKIAGEVDDNFVLDSLITTSNKQDYTSVINLLNSDRTIESKRVEMKDKIKKLEEKKEGIPARIDEVHRSIPDKVNDDEVKKSIAEKEAELKGINDAELTVKAAVEKELHKFDKEKHDISLLNVDKFDVESNITKNAKDAHKKLTDEKAEIKIVCEELVEKKKKCVDQIGNDETNLKETEGEITTLREKIKDLNAENFELDENETICPTCKRELDNADEKKEQLENNFNLDKANRGKNINEDGKKLTNIKKALEVNIEANKSTLSTINEKLVTENAKYRDFVIEPIKTDFTKNKEWNHINTKINELTAKITEPENENKDEKDSAIEVEKEEAKKALNDAIFELKSKLKVNTAIEEKNARIKELRTEQEEVSQKVISLEKELHYIGEFEKSKMNIIEDRVNSMFKIVKWRLFEKRLNDNDNPVCVCLKNGVPFSDLNTAGKTQAGLDIIRTFSDYYKSYFPVWNDNRESISTIPDMKCQIINLYKEEGVKQLTVK